MNCYKLEELLIKIAIILNIISKPDYFGGYLYNYSTPRFSTLLYSLSLVSFKLLKETRFFANREWSAKIKDTEIVISKMTGKHGKNVLLFLFRFLFVMRSYPYLVFDSNLFEYAFRYRGWGSAKNLTPSPCLLAGMPFFPISRSQKWYRRLG